MESKYTVIDDIKAQKRYEDSPVEILRFQILQDTENGEKFLRYTMKNIGQKEIKAVHISIFCYDSEGNKTDEVEAFEYRGIFAKRGECFGEDEVIPINHMASEKFDLYINHVFFYDKTVWNSRRILTLQNPQQLMSENPSFEEMKLACKKAGIGEQAKYVPDIVDRFWRCTCGQMNESNANSCANCKAERSVLNEIFHEDYLKKMQDILKEKKNQKKEKKLQEKNEKRRQKLEENTQNIKRWGTTFMPAIVLIAVLAVALFVGEKFVFPAYHYKKGQKQLEAEQYILAQRQFEKSGDYKDAKKLEAYAGALADIEQIKDETDLGEIYNNIVELDGFQGANMLLDENSYLKQIKALQGKWVSYDGGKRTTYKFSNGNITINGQNVYKIIALGNKIGLQSGERGEIANIVSSDNNEIVMETETEVKVFHKKVKDEKSIYFPVDSYKKVLERMLQDKHKIVDKLKKNSSLYACLNFIDYLYGEGYAQFVQVEKASTKSLDQAQALTLVDGTEVQYQKEIRIDVIARSQEEGMEAEEKHYIGYFDASGETLVALNELGSGILDEENDRKLVEQFNSLNIPNIATLICKQVIDTEMKKDSSLKTRYFTVTAAKTEKSLDGGMFVYIWGTDCNGVNRRIDGVVNYTYQIESTNSEEEQFDRGLYVGSPVYDYAQELAAYLK